MREASHSRLFWKDLERSVLSGKGIDIGCGDDPVNPDVKKFDKDDGDANEITKYVQETFDFVFSSHCLEHMIDPRIALMEWWKLVKPGGYLFFIVPDEDLYEQGIFPSRFNPDHKATFTISKAQSWSPRSFNVLDLAMELPGGSLVKLVLQDQDYDRTLYRHGKHSVFRRVLSWLYFFICRIEGRVARTNRWMGDVLQKSKESLLRFLPDQTWRKSTLAQIECIVRKTG